MAIPVPLALLNLFSEHAGLLLAQALAIAGLLLVLFRLRTKLSLCPLYVALGVFQPIQVLFATSVYLELFPGILVSPGSAVMFTATLFAILLVYIREDAREVRTVIYALVLANVVVSGLYLLLARHVRLDGIQNLHALPASVFQVEARVMISGTIVLFFDAILLILVYEWLRRLRGGLFFLRCFLTLALVLAFDSVAFASGAFLGTEQFQSSLVGGLVGKTLAALVYSVVLFAYFKWIEPSNPGDYTPLRDLFDTLTYREKYAVAQEQALQSTRDHMAREAAILEAVGDGVVVASREGQILDLNPAALEILDCDKESAIGGNLTSWIRAVDGSDWDRQDLAQAAGPMALREVKCGRPGSDGTLAEVSLRATELIDEGVLIVCIRDLTERKELEKQRQEAEVLNTLGAIAVGVAHDFNNHLTAILGAVAIQRLENSTSQSEEGAEIIEDAVGRASALVRQLLAVGKRDVYHNADIDVIGVVKQLEGLLSRLVREDIDLAIETSEESITVFADSSQLEQILLNLVVNAMQAMPDGGRLDVRVDEHRVESVTRTLFRELPAGPYARILVSDTGVGMEPHTSQRAFEPFFTTKEHAFGTGLGLATVRRLVEELGGGLLVESRLGEGTRFTVLLPVSSEMREPAPAVPDGPAGVPAWDALHQESVLICDDNAAVGRVACRMLEKAGFAAHFAHGPTDALRMLETRGSSYDVLVTDMVMPQMSGRNLAAAAREITPDLRVVYVSGYLGTEDGADWTSGDPFVAKPFNISTLSDAIRRRQ